MIFCLTGSFDKKWDVEGLILEAGHNISASIHDGVDHLIVGTVQASNRKVLKAGLLQIPSTTENHLADLLLHSNIVAKQKSISQVTVSVPLDTLREWQDMCSNCLTPKVLYLPDNLEGMKRLAEDECTRGLQELMKQINLQLNNIVEMKHEKN